MALSVTRPSRFAVLFLFCMLLHSLSAAPQLLLTDEEKAFIETHREVKIGVDPHFIPFEFFNEEGEYNGIASDILSEISELTGIDFIPNPSLSWGEAVEGARQREIDLLPAVGFTAARAEYLTYLKPYMQFQRSIVVRNGNTTITGLSDLYGRQVAVQKDSSHEGFLLDYPEISLRTYATVEEALLAVNRGDEVAFVGNEATSAYLSRTLGLAELKFITLAEGGAHDLHMAVRNDWPLLASILQKALDAIPESEYSAIFGNWIRFDSKTDYTWVIRAAIILVVVVILLFSVSSFWILRLRKAVREKDIAQQRAEESDREKSMFMARVSHEIRTPLNGIKGMSYLLEKTKLDAMQNRYLHAIKGASQTMQVIIHDILEYSRLEDGGVVLEYIPFRVDDILQNTISLDSWLIKEKGLTFSLNLDPSVPPFLIGDPTRIRQIFTNLIHNAVKFTSSGEVSLSMKAMETEEEHCVLSCEVRDSGIGMTEDQMSRLFTPFTQADESISRKYGGSGLGLSIVKTLVEAMEGTIEVTSRAGEGSTFRFTLPLDIDREGMEQDLLVKKSVDFTHLKALLVIPDRSFSSQVGTLLKEYQIRYDEVSSLALAETLLSGERSFDLLILEVDHPSVLPASWHTKVTASDGSRPSVILFSLQESSGEELSQVLSDQDVMLPLPFIQSVFFNALLQLFGRGNTADSSTDSISADSAGPPLNVLVVEDNLTNQMIARELLERNNCTVYLAGDGKEGYETFLKNEASIDVILMDLHMDGMDGYESTRLIREKNSEIPILILSADLVDSVKEKCEQMHVSGFIGKPYDPDQLVSRVRTVAANKSPDGSAIPAIDVEAGIRRMGGDRNLYKKVLVSFMEELRKGISDLRSSISENDIERSRELVHMCKGSCGSVGASHAHELCVEVEKELKGEEPVCSSPLMDSLLSELERTLKAAENFS